jgi:hypothetical protein
LFKRFRSTSYILTTTRTRGCFDYMPGSGKVVTRLHLSPPREAGPLTHNIMFQKNKFLLQGSKISRLNYFERGGGWHYKSVWITESSVWHGFWLVGLHCTDVWISCIGCGVLKGCCIKYLSHCFCTLPSYQFLVNGYELVSCAFSQFYIIMFARVYVNSNHKEHSSAISYALVTKSDASAPTKAFRIATHWTKEKNQQSNKTINQTHAWQQHNKPHKLELVQGSYIKKAEQFYSRVADSFITTTCNLMMAN